MSRKKPPPLACPHCIDSYIVIDHEEGEYRCSVCGEVVREQTIDTRSEWRTFENDSADKGRVGQAESEFTTGGMSARIQRNYALERTGNSHAAASSRSGQLAGQDRRVVDVHRLIGAICSRLQLSRVVLETAKKLSHKVEVENVLPVGRNLPARASACVFAAAKIEGQSRTLKEIFAASETSVTRKDVKFIYKKMERAKMWEADGMSHITPEQLVPRFASSADVPRGLHNEIQRVASMTNDFAAGQGGDRRRQPASDAAGAILFVVERQQRLGTTDIAIDSIDIARLRERLQMISGMADTTIRACARDCELNEAFLYPPEEGGGDGGDGGESAAAAKDGGTDGGDDDDGDD